MKNSKEYFIEVLDGELERFVRVFEALPSDKLDWKPDPRSRSAIELASDMAGEPGQLGEVMGTGKFDFDPSKKVVHTSTADIVAEFRSGAAKTKAAITAMTDSDWDLDAVMLVNGAEVWKTTRGDMAWGFLLDMIHHRGQLAVYIRPMGGKVPSIYGPSADANDWTEVWLFSLSMTVHAAIARYQC